MADALRAAVSLGPAARRVADELADELGVRATADPGAQGLEAWLRAGEGQLLDAIDEDTTEAERRALDAEVDRDLRPYGDRLPAKVLAQVRAESRARRRLELHGVPRLSLWSL
jgi:hypothetical protein